MKLTLTTKSPDKQSKMCVIVGIYESGELSPAAKSIDKISHGMITKLLKQGTFSAKTGQTLPLFYIGPFEQVLLVGCGKASALTASAYRKIISSAVKALIPLKITQACCYLSDLDVSDRSLIFKIKFITEVASDALYRFDIFKSDKEPLSLQELSIYADAKKEKDALYALKQGEAIANGVTLTKNLANLPSNICTPSFLAEQAKDLAKSYSAVKVKILGEKEMQKLKMGALLAVSQGSAEEAKLICFEYNGAAKSKAPIAFVGKGITFDSGGNSLKSPENMVGMKYDMCGAATVFGVIKAAAEMKLPLNIVGIIAAVENMPGGTAYKPEDILTSLSGQTIEVISTDAEGRLVLADALTYCERYEPQTVIDIATLTGAAVIALGLHTSALLSNHSALAKDLLKAGEESNDRAWELPLFDEYQEQLKSPFADMANTGGRAAGTITAACFLSRFTKKFNWAHLDVAGTAAMMMGGSERMATGRPVPLLMQYLSDKANH